MIIRYGILLYTQAEQEARMQEPKEGTTRYRVLEFLEHEGDREVSLNGIVLGVDGSAAAIRHAVESLLRSEHIKERVEHGPATTYTRRISLNRDRVEP